MNILALDTSSSACSIALQHGDVISIRHEIAPMQQAKLILPMIQDLLAASSLSIKDLDAIAYGAGPGSFTGIRIASSVAQGLSFPSNIPVVPVSSLAAMAQSAFLEHQHQRLLVAVDARMDQIYWAIYDIDSAGLANLMGEERLCYPNEVLTLSENEQFGIGIGDGWTKYQDILTAQLGIKPTSIYPNQLPSAEAILKLALQKLHKGEKVASSLALPVYLR